MTIPGSVRTVLPPLVLGATRSDPQPAVAPQSTPRPEDPPPSSLGPIGHPHSRVSFAASPPRLSMPALTLRCRPTGTPGPPSRGPAIPSRGRLAEPWPRHTEPWPTRRYRAVADSPSRGPPDDLPWAISIAQRQSTGREVSAVERGTGRGPAIPSRVPARRSPLGNIYRPTAIDRGKVPGRECRPWSAALAVVELRRPHSPRPPERTAPGCNIVVTRFL
jgi:hypothetical protein